MWDHDCTAIDRSGNLGSAGGPENMTRQFFVGLAIMIFVGVKAAGRATCNNPSQPCMSSASHSWSRRLPSRTSNLAFRPNVVVETGFERWLLRDLLTDQLPSDSAAEESEPPVSTRACMTCRSVLGNYPFTKRLAGRVQFVVFVWGSRLEKDKTGEC